MSTTNERILTALPCNVRGVIDLLHELITELIGYTEAVTWRVLNLTPAERNILHAYLLRPGNGEYFDAYHFTRKDFVPSLNTLFVRLPSPIQTIFTQAIESNITSMIMHYSNFTGHGWFLAFVVGVNAKRDPAKDLVVGEHQPDICFYFRPPASITTRTRKNARDLRKPPIIIEVCNHFKHADMKRLAECYMRYGDGAIRTVVAIDTVSGTYSVWRYLRYLPTRVEGKEYRKCFHTEKEVPWRGEDAKDLVLRVRDFLPTDLPSVEDIDEEDMDALTRKSITLSAQRLTELYNASRMVVENAIADSDSESEAEIDMDLSTTEEDPEIYGNVEAVEMPPNDQDDENQDWNEDGQANDETTWEDSDEEFDDDELSEVMADMDEGFEDEDFSTTTDGTNGDSEVE